MALLKDSEIANPRRRKLPVQRMKSYHFNVGDSDKGPLGFCARVSAKTKKRALSILQQRLRNLTSQCSGDIRAVDIKSDPEYIVAYINLDHLTIKQIDEWEHDDE